MWDKREVVGVSSISALQLSSGLDGSGEPEAGQAIANATSRNMAPRPVEFIRPRTADTAFEAWAGEPTEKTVTIELFNIAGASGLTFLLEACVPVAYSPLDALDANSSGIATERLVVRCTTISRPANP